MNILLVDDDATTRNPLENSMTKWGYSVAAAENGRQAIALLKSSENIDMIVSEWRMPALDGLAMCAEVRSLNLSQYIYVILISAQDKRTDIVRGLQGGVDDHIGKPINLDELKARLEIGARIVRLERELNQRYLAIKCNYYQSIQMLAQFMETYDESLGGHSRRVGQLSLELAQRHPTIHSENYPVIEAAGLLHDIGLIGLPGALVQKSVPEMNGEEKALYRTHPERGEKILSQVDLLKPVASLVRLHHEQVNGRGFPDGVTKEHLPLGAMVISAASLYDDMVYRRALSIDEVTDRIHQMRGYQLPSDLVDLLLEKNLEMISEESKRTSKEVDIENLKAGMVLAMDVHMKSGAFVMSAGTQIDSDAIEKLKKYYDLGNISNKVLINK